MITDFLKKVVQKQKSTKNFLKKILLIVLMIGNRLNSKFLDQFEFKIFRST